ncbi:hypothetical protein DN402_19085 [Streptomyces sp. SW4]|nr:hypothetical protein DN402_19085 [Streptomyces sp. SW4]
MPNHYPLSLNRSTFGCVPPSRSGGPRNLAPAALPVPDPGAAAPRPPLRPERPRPQTPDGLAGRAGRENPAPPEKSSPSGEIQPLRRLRSGVRGGAPG